MTKLEVRAFAHDIVTLARKSFGSHLPTHDELLKRLDGWGIHTLQLHQHLTMRMLHVFNQALDEEAQSCDEGLEKEA